MEMTNIPYTIEAITEYLRKIFPEDDTDVDNWVKNRFENFKQTGRNKLPDTIKERTLRFKWARLFKQRGRIPYQSWHKGDSFDPSPSDENNIRHYEGD